MMIVKLPIKLKRMRSKPILDRTFLVHNPITLCPPHQVSLINKNTTPSANRIFELGHNDQSGMHLHYRVTLSRRALTWVSAYFISVSDCVERRAAEGCTQIATLAFTSPTRPPEGLSRISPQCFVTRLE